MLRLVLTAAVLLTAVPATAEDWRLVRVIGDAPGRYAALIDNDSIDRTNPAKPTFNTAILLEGGMKVEGVDNPLHQLVSVQVVDCAANTITVMSTKGYDKAGTHRTIDDSQIVQNVVPDQPGAVYRDASCDFKWASDVSTFGNKPLTMIGAEVFGS